MEVVSMQAPATLASLADRAFAAEALLGLTAYYGAEEKRASPTTRPAGSSGGSSPTTIMPHARRGEGSAAGAPSLPSFDVPPPQQPPPQHAAPRKPLQWAALAHQQKLCVPAPDGRVDRGWVKGK